MGLHGGRRRHGREQRDRRKKLAGALIWQLDWGEQAERIKAAACEAGGAVPPLPFLQNEPDLPEHLAFEWGAFQDLSRDRQSGMGIGPIPWSAFDRYARRHGIDDPDSFERFVALMAAMDAAFCRHHAEKEEANRTK
jgi:hypothetical protein